ncbi:MAG: DUF4340 domain-containing protein, partial [Myxococcota bacterium]
MKRLIAASVAFAVLLVAVLVVTSRRNREEEEPPADQGSELPAIDEEKITELSIRRPGGEAVVLVAEGDTWRLSEPLDADANDDYVQLALNKLETMAESSTGIAATKAANHEKLEVAESNGVEVIARGEGSDLAHLFLGANRGGATMVRVAGDDPVHSVRGNLGATFGRSPDDWREKRVVDEVADELRELRFEGDDESLHFVRADDGQWAQAEGQDEIEEFSPDQVQAVASTLARMQAGGFAEPDVTPAQAGLDEGSSTATLTLEKTDEEGEAATEEQIVLRLGNALEGKEERYLLREGRDPIYTVSKFLSERIAPEAELFTKSAEEDQPQG